MKKYVWSKVAGPALIGLLTTLSICCSKALRPETQLAAAATAFQKSEKAFISARTRTAKNRQRTLNALEMGGAQARQDAERLVSVWQVAGDKEKARLYEEVLAATKAASERMSAITKLRDEHEVALAQADTKVSLDQEKLARAIKLLGNLGAGLSRDEWVKFFIAFAKKTQEDVKEAAKEADGGNDVAEDTSTSGTTP